jgi:hypothetical protein
MLPILAMAPGVAVAVGQEPESAGGAEARPAPAEAKEPVLAVFAGEVHPVSGPSLRDAVVLVRGDRIAAIGPRAEVAVPAEAARLEFPAGHVYPGLVDALTDAFLDGPMRSDPTFDAGITLGEALRLRFDRDDDLARAGITTAHVAARVPSNFRGQGTIVRPGAGTFTVWSGREKAAVQVRMTTGPAPGHALQRLASLESIGAAFEGLDAYRKSFEDHQKAVEKYTKDFADYLAWHEKKKASGEAKPAERPAAAPAREGTPPAREGAPREGGRRQGGGRGGGGNAAGGEPTASPPDAGTPQEPARQEPGKQEPPKLGPPKPDEKPEDKPPARPQYPATPARDPQKDALLAVLDGALTLRAEVHRLEEVRGALAVQTARKIPVLVLEQAYGAAPAAADLAAAGVACVLTDVLPGSLPKEYEAWDPVTLPAALHAQGVAFAIASGGARRALALRLMAAAAVGGGLPEDEALRAITLSAAEILGVGKDTGSLQAGKFADLLITDKPLFASDCRVLRVLSGGATIFEENR